MPVTRPPPPLLRLADLCRYSALPVGLYAVGLMLLLDRAYGGGAAPSASAVAVVFLVASAVYALDRVKLTDARLDPADRDADPERFSFTARHSRSIRAAVVVAFLAAAAVSAGLSVVLPPAVLLGAAAIVIYAGRPADPDRPRPKDLPLLKNLFIAAGLVGFVSVIALLDARRPDPLDPWAAIDLWLRFVFSPGPFAVTVAAGLLVGCDAALCDISDEAADRRWGTRTLPVLIGARRTSWLALAGLAAASGVWLAADASSGVGVAAACLLGAAVMMLRPHDPRDLIDARLLPCALLTLLL